VLIDSVPPQQKAVAACEGSGSDWRRWPRSWRREVVPEVRGHRAGCGRTVRPDRLGVGEPRQEQLADRHPHRRGRIARVVSPRGIGNGILAYNYRRNLAVGVELHRRRKQRADRFVLWHRTIHDHQPLTQEANGGRPDSRSAPTHESPFRRPASTSSRTGTDRSRWGRTRSRRWCGWCEWDRGRAGRCGQPGQPTG
jgi:hypothetical protein